MPYGGDDKDPRNEQQVLAGRGLIVLGLLFLMAVGAMAYSHYGLGQPVHVKRSGRLVPESQIALVVAAFGLVGGSCIAIGRHAEAIHAMLLLSVGRLAQQGRRIGHLDLVDRAALNRAAGFSRPRSGLQPPDHASSASESGQR